MPIYTMPVLASRGIWEADVYYFGPLILEHNYILSMVNAQVVSVVFIINFYFNLLSIILVFFSSILDNFALPMSFSLYELL